MNAPAPLLAVHQLTKRFTRGGGLFEAKIAVRAVEDVSFTVDEGEMFALVGESGCGKTTTGRCVLRLIEPTSGQVVFRGEDVTAAPAARLRQLRRHMQIVFQDPYSSLNPRMRVGDIIEEPLVIHGVGGAAERRERVDSLLQMVGLDRDHLRRYPHEFSGGQRQRIGIARALALDPSFVVADEAVSALDVSIQAQIVDLIVELKERLGLAFLFIAHDLRLVENISNRVAVMRRGRIVETGCTGDVFARPTHPYTQALLSAVPALDPDTRRPRVTLDERSFDPEAPLREVREGHWAAV